MCKSQDGLTANIKLHFLALVCFFWLSVDPIYMYCQINLMTVSSSNNNGDDEIIIHGSGATVCVTL